MNSLNSSISIRRNKYLILFFSIFQTGQLTVGGIAEGNDRMSVTSGQRIISTSPGSSDNVDYAQSRYANDSQ